jgi:hypothetical protein
MMHLPPHAIHGHHGLPHPMHLSHPYHPVSLPHGPTGFLLNPSGDSGPPIAYALPPPPPSYQEALTAGHALIQPLNPASLQEIGQQQHNQGNNANANNSSHGNRSRGEMTSHSNNRTRNTNNSEVTVTTSGVTVEPTTVITVEAVTHRTNEEDHDNEDQDNLSCSPDLVSSCHMNSRVHEVSPSSSSSSVRQQQRDHLHNNNNNSSLILMPTSSSLRGNNNNCVTICTVNDGDNTCSFDGYSVSGRNTELTTSQARMTSTEVGTTDLESESSSDERNGNSRLHFVTIIEATI